MVTRPDEPIPGGLGPDEKGGPPPDAPEEEQAPFEIDTEKLRVEPDEE